jgi:hypothetical protein
MPCFKEDRIALGKVEEGGIREPFSSARLSLLARKRVVWCALTTTLVLAVVALFHKQIPPTEGLKRVLTSKYRWDISFPDASSTARATDGLDYVLGPMRQDEHEDGFTIVTPTLKREELLPAFLDNYATGNIPSLKKILLLWVNLTKEVPEYLRGPALARSNYTVPIEIQILREPSLNQRFRPNPSIKTSCVFSLDDDILMTPAEVEAGYVAWRELGQRRRMLGFAARRVGANFKYHAATGDYYQ